MPTEFANATNSAAGGLVKKRRLHRHAHDSIPFSAFAVVRNKSVSPANQHLRDNGEQLSCTNANRRGSSRDLITSCQH
jgi:hypothetical protein